MKELIALRPAMPDDRDFLVRVYEASREIELSMTPWSTAERLAFARLQFDAQTRHYGEVYPDSTNSVILYDGEPAGRLHLNRGPDQIAILDITVLPAYRLKGIATSLITSLQAEAKESGCSLRVFVEDFNPSQAMFLGVGFEIAAREGINLRLEWRPPK
ncbi:MAG: N-acetyltransferase family protein [Pyrinomonadaceae bacterium]